MKITSKDLNVQSALLILGVLLLIWNDASSKVFPAIFYVCVSIIAGIYIIGCNVAYGRTFTFDKTGCTVSLWKYKKHYDWEEFECVRYYDYSKPRFRKLGLTGGIMFSKKPIELRRTSLNLYCFFHPLSCVYVTFINEKRPKGLTYRDAYTAPKERFENKLKAWGVEVQYPNA